ncbi:MAG TPA: hypothetical protein GYA07_14925 [Verrucomicrobia bacterium]|nr:hypothetical protein [Verrucomicrobiota bacterium]HOP96217.1 hypothetical protein [Verrucomicrobiota bacterium]HPU55969.1 hypothetical protein [Verrucomicrobiota bacterium]
MNDITIEKLLSRAPAPQPPPGLFELLESQIVLPARALPGCNGSHGPSLLRWWMPALAFGLFFLSCMILVGVQFSWISQLKRENEQFRASGVSSARVEQLEQQLAAIRGLASGLEALRNQQDELPALQAEFQELKGLPDEIAALRESNHQLKTALARAGSVDELWLEQAQEEEEKRLCVEKLKQVGLAIRIWSNDHEDLSPTSFSSLSNEVDQVQILICPGDKARQAYASVPFSEFAEEMSSYQLLATGGRDEVFPDSIMLKCSIHHNYGLADGSVQSMTPGEYREVLRDNGRWYLEAVSPESE